MSNGITIKTEEFKKLPQQEQLVLLFENTEKIKTVQQDSQKKISKMEKTSFKSMVLSSLSLTMVIMGMGFLIQHIIGG